VIRTRWFTFASAPKCGCVWFRKLIEELGIEYRGARWHEPGHVDSLPSITIKRCPADWLQSCYQNLNSIVGPPLVDCFLDLRMNNQTFEDFAESYIAEMPGGISRMFRSYQPSTYTLNLATIRSDVVEIFTRLFIPFDIDFILEFPDQNVSKRHAHVSDHLKQRIVNAA